MPRVHQAPIDKTVLQLTDLDPFEEMVSTSCFAIFRHGWFSFNLSMILMLPDGDCVGQPVLLYCHC